MTVSCRLSDQLLIGCQWSWWGKVLSMLLIGVLVVKMNWGWFLVLVFGVRAGTDVMQDMEFERVPT